MSGVAVVLVAPVGGVCWVALKLLNSDCSPADPERCWKKLSAIQSAFGYGSSSCMWGVWAGWIVGWWEGLITAAEAMQARCPHLDAAADSTLFRVKLFEP